MPPDESSSSFPWDIRRQGRPWTRCEWEARRDSTPEKIELIGGKLFWTDEIVWRCSRSCWKMWESIRLSGLGILDLARGDRRAWTGIGNEHFTRRRESLMSVIDPQHRSSGLSVIPLCPC